MPPQSAPSIDGGHTCLLLQFVGVQVDVTSKTEGTAIGDKSGVPLLVKYDTRLREKGKNAVNEINSTVQVNYFHWRAIISNLC